MNDVNANESRAPPSLDRIYYAKNSKNPLFNDERKYIMEKIDLTLLEKFKGQKNDIPVQLDISERGKITIKDLADAAKVDVSKYLRCCVLDEEIFQVIDPSGDISKLLIEINDHLSCSLRERKMEQKQISTVIYKLNSAYDSLDKLIKLLPVTQYTDSFTADNETVKNYSNELKTAHIQFKVSGELKTFIETKASTLEMSTSRFIRVAALANEPVFILGHGKYAVRHIIEIQDNIKKLGVNGIIDDKSLKILSGKATDIFNIFIKLTQKLTNINNIDSISTEEAD